MVRLVQIFAIKKKQRNDTTTDGGIGKVEYRAEEYEVLPTYKRHPSGPGGVDYREIEHVYHFTIKPSGISSSFGHKAGNLRMGAFIKDYPIEYTVDNVP